MHPANRSKGKTFENEFFVQSVFIVIPSMNETNHLGSEKNIAQSVARNKKGLN